MSVVYVIPSPNILYIPFALVGVPTSIVLLKLIASIFIMTYGLFTLLLNPNNYLFIAKLVNLQPSFR